MLQSLGKISRLKGFFRTGINYSCYEEMLSLAEKKLLDVYQKIFYLV